MICDEKHNLEPVVFGGHRVPQFRKKLLFLMLGFMCICGFQYLCWKDKVIGMAPADYAKFAADLKVTEKKRYGYCLTYHGAFLVKTRNTEELGSAIADKKRESTKREEKGEEQEEGYEDDADSIREQKLSQGKEYDGVKRAMLRELELVRTKTMMEAVLYLGVFFLIFWGPSWLVHLKFLSSRSPLWKEFWAGMIFGMIGFWVMAMPLILLDYGAPLFSTWVGPGAMSYSTGMRASSFGSGMTISYRNILEMLIFWPSVFYLAIADMIPEWAQGPVFYALFAPAYHGGLLGLCRAIWLDVRRMKLRKLENH